jgi:hypothetical protein
VTLALLACRLATSKRSSTFSPNSFNAHRRTIDALLGALTPTESSAGRGSGCVGADSAQGPHCYREREDPTARDFWLCSFRNDHRESVALASRSKIFCGAALVINSEAATCVESADSDSASLTFREEAYEYAGVYQRTFVIESLWQRRCGGFSRA